MSIDERGSSGFAVIGTDAPEPAPEPEPGS
jgi:hypothetical protein